MIARLEQAFTTRGRSLLREVHTLASSARSVGLLRVGHAAAALEQAMEGEEPDAERLAGLLDLLRQSLARLADRQAAQPQLAESRAT